MQPFEQTLIGAGIMTLAVGKALRSMAESGNTALTWSGDNPPVSMAGYVKDVDVHTNSGILNHAFYLAAMKLCVNIWEKAARSGAASPATGRDLPICRQRLRQGG